MTASRVRATSYKPDNACCRMSLLTRCFSIQRVQHLAQAGQQELPTGAAHMADKIALWAFAGPHAAALEHLHAGVHQRPGRGARAPQRSPEHRECPWACICGPCGWTPWQQPRTLIYQSSSEASWRLCRHQACFLFTQLAAVACRASTLSTATRCCQPAWTTPSRSGTCSVSCPAVCVKAQPWDPACATQSSGLLAAAVRKYIEESHNYDSAASAEAFPTGRLQAPEFTSSKVPVQFLQWQLGPLHSCP